MDQFSSEHFISTLPLSGDSGLRLVVATKIYTNYVEEGVASCRNTRVCESIRLVRHGRRRKTLEMEDQRRHPCDRYSRSRRRTAAALSARERVSRRGSLL